MSNASSKENGSAAQEGEEGYEYSCKYCEKKFTNKQALGGHQNAHKLERSMEKGARNQVGGSSSHDPMITSHHFTGSYNGSPQVFNSSNFHHPNNTIGSPLPMVTQPYGPYQFHNVYPQTHYGWNGHVPRMSQFATPTRNLPYVGVNAQSPIIGAGSSIMRPVVRDLPYAGSRLLSSANPGSGINNHANNQVNEEVEDDNLDLTLKL